MYEHYSAFSISLTAQYALVSQRSNSVHQLSFREKPHGYQLCPLCKPAVDLLAIPHILSDGLLHKCKAPSWRVKNEVLKLYGENNRYHQ